MKKIMESTTNLLRKEVEDLQDYINNHFKFQTTVSLGEFNVGQTTIDFTLEIDDETGWNATYEVSYQNGEYSLYESSCSIETDVEQVLKEYYEKEENNE